MFVKINIRFDDGTEFPLSFNLVNITVPVPYNLKNIDAGTIIKLRTMEEYYTPWPIDVVMNKIDKAVSDLSSSVLITMIAEASRDQKPTPVKRTRKKTTK